MQRNVQKGISTNSCPSGMRDGKQDLRCAFLASSREQMSQLHWKDSYLVIELGRLYLGRARVIRVTVAPGPSAGNYHYGRPAKPKASLQRVGGPGSRSRAWPPPLGSEPMSAAARQAEAPPSPHPGATRTTVDGRYRHGNERTYPP
jgi:hypothetical protein